MGRIKRELGWGWGWGDGMHAFEKCQIVPQNIFFLVPRQAILQSGTANEDPGMYAGFLPFLT